MVKNLEQMPGTFSRSAWNILIDGKVITDWVMANLRWIDADDRLEIQIGVPLTLDTSFADMTNKRKAFTVELRGLQQGAPIFAAEKAFPVRYELQPMEMHGAWLDGLDVRSDMPVIQCITFRGRPLKGKVMRIPGETG
jgi:hypothetical protein